MLSLSDPGLLAQIPVAGEPVSPGRASTGITGMWAIARSSAAKVESTAPKFSHFSRSGFSSLFQVRCRRNCIFIPLIDDDAIGTGSLLRTKELTQCFGQVSVT